MVHHKISLVVSKPLIKGVNGYYICGKDLTECTYSGSHFMNLLT